MQFKAITRAILVLTAVAIGGSPAWAQKVEVNPYGGFFFPFDFADSDSLKDEGIYGVRGSVNVPVFGMDSFEVEGNFGYINHFEFEGTDPESSAFLWEANGTFPFRLGSRFEPFVTAGVGGLTVSLDNADAIYFQSVVDGPGGSGGDRFVQVDPSALSGDSRAIRIADNDSFFAFNYGGGVRANRLWGPLGLRFDVRGRTLPNFAGGRQNSWIETTGGITLSWGE